MNIKPNLSEIGNIVKSMTADYKAAPNYNAAAAAIVKQGADDKLRARYEYNNLPTPPAQKKTL